MFPSWTALSAIFLALHTQVLSPSHPSGRMMGIDFGEPTRNCAGRGQICRIEPLGAWSPEAFGEMWTGEDGTVRLAVWECFLESEDDFFEALRSDGKLIIRLPPEIFKPR